MKTSPALSAGPFATQTSTDSQHADEEAPPNPPLSSEAEFEWLDHNRHFKTHLIHAIWPDYALPEERLPRPTSDDLHDRIARLSETQSNADADRRYAIRRRNWAKELRMSGEESPSSVILIRSRWLVIETIDCHLELWDIEASAGPIATFDALAGSVDGHVVEDEAGEPAQLHISTTMHQVYSFILDLPYRQEDRVYASSLHPHKTIFGFSGLKAKQTDWWAFAKIEEKSIQGFLYHTRAKTPFVRLACANGVNEKQNVLDILLGSSSVVVARNDTIDIYNRSALAAVLDSTRSESSASLPIVKPQQSLPPPAPGFLHHVRLFSQQPVRVGTSFPRIIYASFSEPGWRVNTLERDGTDDSTKPSAMYTISSSRRVARGINNPLILEWGCSGSRMIALGELRMEMYFVDPQQPPNDADWTDYKHRNYGPLLASWNLPNDMEDIPRCAAFDEATGIVVAGMHSGRILVADAGDSVLPPLSPEEDAKWPTRWLNYPKRKTTSNPPHPSPKRWPGFGSNPVFTEPESTPESKASYEVVPGWFHGVDRFYPFINQPNSYGSMPWLVQDLAGIPSDAECVLVSSKDLSEEFGEDAAVIELDAEAGKGGTLLLLSWDDDDPIEPELLRFQPEVTTKSLIDSMREGVPARRLCDERALPFSRVSVGQLMAWVDRRQASGTSPVIIKMPARH